MDNRLNEIRRKIRFLRSQMLDAESTIRQHINRDEDCAEASMQLMAMRVVMLGLIGDGTGSAAKNACSMSMSG